MVVTIYSNFIMIKFQTIDKKLYDSNQGYRCTH